MYWESNRRNHSFGGCARWCDRRLTFLIECFLNISVWKKKYKSILSLKKIYFRFFSMTSRILRLNTNLVACVCCPLRMRLRIELIVKTDYYSKRCQVAIFYHMHIMYALCQKIFFFIFSSICERVRRNWNQIWVWKLREDEKRTWKNHIRAAWNIIWIYYIHIYMYFQRTFGFSSSNGIVRNAYSQQHSQWSTVDNEYL